MNVTVNVLCYKSKVLSNGEHPLMLRINNNGTDEIGLFPEWFSSNWCAYYVWT